MKYSFFTLITAFAALTSAYADEALPPLVDPKTGYAWEQNSVENTFEDAEAFCRSLNPGTTADWQVPTLSQVKALIRHLNDEPSTQSARVVGEYWTRTSLPGFDKKFAVEIHIDDDWNLHLQKHFMDPAALRKEHKTLDGTARESFRALCVRTSR